MTTTTTEVRSTTGTAPLRFVPSGGTLVRVDLEDGSCQVYDARALAAAVLGAAGMPGMARLMADEAAGR